MSRLAYLYATLSLAPGISAQEAHRLMVLPLQATQTGTVRTSPGAVDAALRAQLARVPGCTVLKEPQGKDVPAAESRPHPHALTPQDAVRLARPLGATHVLLGAWQGGATTEKRPSYGPATGDRPQRADIRTHRAALTFRVQLVEVASGRVLSTLEARGQSVTEPASPQEALQGAILDGTERLGERISRVLVAGH